MTEQRFDVLDGWRGVCALLVCAYHFPAQSHLLHAPLVRHAWLFVDFFFALSGFVVTHAYAARLRNRRDFAAFAIRRFGRLWPLHVATLAGFLLLEVAKLLLLRGHGLAAERPPFTGATSLASLPAQLTLTHALPPATTITWNGPSWSIGVEFWAYLLFAVVLLAAVRPNRVFAALLAISLAVLWWAGNGLHQGPGLGLFRCVAGFVAGHFAYRLWRRLRPSAATGAEVAALAAVALFVVHAPGTPAELLAPALFAAAILVFAGENGAVSRLLRHPVARSLGGLSFSIYMTHWLLRELLLRAVALAGQRTGRPLTVPVPPDLRVELAAGRLIAWHGPWGGDLLLALFLAATVIVSRCTWRWIELPGQRAAARLANVLLARSTGASSPLRGQVPRFLDGAEAGTLPTRG